MADRRARKLDLEGTPVREHTDALAIAFPRHDEPARVAAVVQVSMRRPHEEAHSPLTGQKKFKAAASLMLGRVLRPHEPVEGAESVPTDLSNTMSQHLRLAALPHCAIRLDRDTLDTDIGELLGWLDTEILVEPGSP